MMNNIWKKKIRFFISDMAISERGWAIKKGKLINKIKNRAERISFLPNTVTKWNQEERKDKGSIKKKNQTLHSKDMNKKAQHNRERESRDGWIPMDMAEQETKNLKPLSLSLSPGWTNASPAPLSIFLSLLFFFLLLLCSYVCGSKKRGMWWMAAILERRQEMREIERERE